MKPGWVDPLTLVDRTIIGTIVKVRTVDIESSHDDKACGSGLSFLKGVTIRVGGGLLRPTPAQTR